MRNLKKVLSLALALVMLLGMMVVGAGAATSFKDDDDIKNKEAVAVLVGMGVMKGREDGTNFAPDATLTRAEAAKMIAQLDLGVQAADALVANGTNPFSDVWTGHWAAGPIDYCVEQGYINGDGNGHFFPSRNVTSVEFGIMLLRLLGYDEKVEGLTGDKWAINGAALARKAGLTTKVVANNTDMTRDDMAQMAFNALTASMVEYEGMDITIGDVTFNARVKVRTHSQDQGGLSSSKTYDSKIPTPTTPIRLCEERFPDLKLTTGWDVFGRPQSVWTWKQVNIAGSEATYADDANSHTDDAPDTKAVIDGDTATFLNGKQIANPAKLSNLAANGRLVQVYYWDNDQSSIYRITAIDTFVARVVSVNSDKGTVTVTPLSGHTPEDKPALLNKTFEATGFSAGDIVTYKAAWNKTDGKYDIKEMTALTDPATGTLTAWRGTNVIEAGEKGGDRKDFTVDGNTYEYSFANYVADMEGNKQDSGVAGFAVNKDQIDVYVDEYGFAIYVSGVEAEKNYAAVIGVGSSNTHGSETTGVTLLFPDGTQKAVTAKVKGLASPTATTNPNKATALSTANADGVGSSSDAQLVTDPIADVVSYRIDDNGVYELTLLGYTASASGATKAGSYTGKYWTSDGSSGSADTPDTENELGIGQTTGPRASNTGASFTNGKSELLVGTETLYANSKTIFMVCTDDGRGGYNYNVYTGYQEMPSFLNTGITGIAYGTRNTYSKQLDIVYIYADAVSGMSASNTYFVVEKGQTIYTDSTGSYMVVNAIVDGEETTVKVSTACSPAVVNDDAAKPGLYLATNVIKNRNDIITSFNTASMSSGTGTVKPDRVVLGVDGNEATAKYFAYNDKTQVIMVPEDFKSISLVPMDSVLTDGNDEVHYSFTDANNKVLKDVVIVEVDNTASFTVAGNTGYQLSTDNSTWKTAGTGINVKDGSKGYVKAADDYEIDVAATKAKGITLTKESSDPDVYSFVVTENITNDKIVTKSTLPQQASKYSSVTKTGADTAAATLAVVDFSGAGYARSSNTISQFNKIVGRNLLTQITDYLTYEGFTEVGAVSRNSSDNGYEIVAKDPDGIGVKVTLADSAVDDINEVTVDGKVYYVADGTDAISTNILTSANGTAYAKTTHGTYAKCSDGSFVDVTATGAVASCKSYTTGYFKVEGKDAHGSTPVEVNISSTENTAGAVINGNGVVTTGKFSTKVDIDAAANGEYVAADKAWYVKKTAVLSVTIKNVDAGVTASALGSVVITVPSGATATVGTDTVDGTNNKIVLEDGDAAGSQTLTVTVKTFVDNAVITFTGAAT